MVDELAGCRLGWQSVRLPYLECVLVRLIVRVLRVAGALGCAAMLATGNIAAAQAASSGPRLIPQPRELHMQDKAALTGISVEVPGGDADDLFAAEDLRTHAQSMGLTGRAKGALQVILLRANDPKATQALGDEHLTLDPAMEPEGYVLAIHHDRATVIAGTGSGVFYGVQTLKQMIEGSGSGATIWSGTVRDWPAMRYRGVHDDLSRGPVPTLDFQKHQLEVLASYKVNLYSPYFEHTLEYEHDLLAAPPGGAVTPEQARELVAFARQRHITIVPEQEAFGHLHHVLKFDKYSELTETPHGHVLAPGQAGTLPLINSWFTQIAEDFPSPFLHVGADETFDLGTGRTKEAVQKRGLGPVYADFLSQIHNELAPLNRRILFWGDVAWSDPSAVAGIPKDMIAIPWIYWHEDNYDVNITPFKKAGIETWVAPGDANWRMVYPLGAVALDNIAGFVESGQRLGSTGELLAIWNDDGEGLFNQDWFGVLFGAAAAWQPGRSQPEPYERAFGLRFYNDASGRIDEAQRELIAAQKLMETSNESFWMDPWSPQGLAVLAKARPVLHDVRLHAERAIELIAGVEKDATDVRESRALKAMELGARRMDFMAQKFEWSDDIGAAYAQAYTLRNDPKRAAEASNLLYTISSMNGRCQDLRDGYALLKSMYRDVWLAENRPYWLDNVLVRYDLQMQLWQTRGVQFDTLIHNFQSKKGLPTAHEAGLPPAPPQM